MGKKNKSNIKSNKQSVQPTNLRPSGIGGQAVLEGIMMRNKNKYAVGVRKPDSEIEVQVFEYKGLANANKFVKLPFIRGIFNFIDSLVLGIKSLTFSAEFYDEEVQEEEKLGDKAAKKVFKEKAEAVMIGATVVFSIFLSVAVFVVLPYLISSFVSKLLKIDSETFVSVVEGILRILIFVLYIWLISLMKDIKRTYMYHGAEHKCINCIEHGLELNVKNVQVSSKHHKRCGTSFMLFVVFISVVCFILISIILPENMNVLSRVGIRILMVPVVAGISYEILRLAGRKDNLFVKIISSPGLLMQRLTTAEPDDSMIEVAIAAVEAVFDWRAYLAGEEVGSGCIFSDDSCEPEESSKKESKKASKKESKNDKVDEQIEEELKEEVKEEKESFEKEFDSELEEDKELDEFVQDFLEDSNE